MWILGQGGFFGSAIAHAATLQSVNVFPHAKIPWNSPVDRAFALKELARQFSDVAPEAPTTIIWAAGSEGVGKQQLTDCSELDAFQDFVQAISNVEKLKGSTVAIVSSAGGVLGGSPSPPFDIHTPVHAINQYGQDKIAIEELGASKLSSDFRVHIARVTNLYGPWFGPRQGLINRLCTAAASREALQIFVPLDTVRDYIYVTDAAQLLLLEITADLPSISLIGSGENSSVGTVISTVSHVARRKVPITLARLAISPLQTTDLRMHPSWLDRGLHINPMPLAQGVKLLFDSLVTVPRWNQSIALV
jgi:UDP-glucose 4-epimerase